ncbi:NADP-dependent oxidoreductase [Spirillospora sp. NPDC049652]|jgi:NADPH:quinone reductase-like Zn-dependent oxidoreductase
MSTLPTSMRAALAHSPEDAADGITVETVPVPRPATGDVLVEVRAAGIVPDELSWPGTWTDRAGRDRAPSIPAHEVAGVVAAVRYGTTGFQEGDRVVGLADWHRDGGAAGYIAVEARDLARLPDEVSFTDAAALPIAGLTAWQGLFTHAGLAPGQTVLVHGAGGGTGSLAVQLAREAGARVLATGRARDAALARDLGADEFVALEDGRFEDAGPVDVVFDTIGGDVLARSASVVRPGGTLVSITAPPPELPGGTRGVVFIVEPNRDQLAQIVQRAADGRISPRVGATYPLAEARAAFHAKRSGVPGKVVITL